MAALSPETMEVLRREIERIATHEGMELVDLEFKRERGNWTLRVFIDRVGGVRLGDCAEISEQVGLMLDVEDLIPSSYTLEVSSPGLDRVLKKPRDFERFIGRLVRIKLKADTSGRKKFLGRLEGLDGGDVIINDESENREHRLPMDRIQSARLEIEL